MKKIFVSVKFGLPKQKPKHTKHKKSARYQKYLAFMKKRPKMDQLLAMRQKQLRASKSVCERLVKSALDQIGIRYIYQKGFLCKGEAVRLVDFFLPDNNIILEIDGKEHERDKDEFRENQILRSAPRYTFLRITNDEVLQNKEGLEQFILTRIYEHRKNLRPSAGNDSRMVETMNAQCRHATWDKVAVKLEAVNDNTVLKADDKIQRNGEPTSDEQSASALVPFKDIAYLPGETPRLESRADVKQALSSVKNG